MRGRFVRFGFAALLQLKEERNPTHSLRYHFCSDVTAWRSMLNVEPLITDAVVILKRYCWHW